MKSLFSVAILTLVINSGWSQSAPIPICKQLTYHTQEGTFDSAEEITDVSPYGLEANNILRQAYTHTAVDKKQHSKYHQYYKNTRVLGGTQVFHTQNGNLYATSGHLAPISSINVEPTISIKSGKQLTSVYLKKHVLPSEMPHLLGRGLDFQITHKDKVIVGMQYPRPSKKYTLAHVYEVEAQELNVPFHMEVYVDAHTGKYISAISKIQDNTVPGHGDGFYHQNITFNTDSIGPSTFILRDITRGGGVFAYDIAQDYEEFEDNDNDWQFDTDQGKAALDGYYATLKYYDLLQEKFGRASIDDNDTPLTVNLNQNLLVNAFWNGTEATFGSGNCNDYNPLTTFEIVAHEFTHGLTDYTSNLVYAYESGALNESMSDIFGKAAEYYYDNEHANWYIGAALPKSPSARPFRSMKDPNERFDPKYYKGTYWVSSEADRGGVHSNSGVLNHWFYLLVEGGTGVNEGGYTFAVEGIGMDKAIQIAYLMQTSYLTELSGYTDATIFAAAAATDLYGMSSPEYAAVVEAWKAVGLDINNLPGADRDLDLDITYNLKGTFSEFCPDEFSNMEITLINPSETAVPAGSTLTGTATISYIASAMQTDETIDINPQFLADGLPLGQTLSVYISHQVENDPVQITIDLDLEFSTDTEPYSFQNSADLSISDRETAEVDLLITEQEDSCDPSQGLSFEYMSFLIPICNSVSNSRLIFTFSGPGGQVDFEEELLPFLGSDHLVFNPINNVNIASIGRLDQVSMTIHYVADGEVYLIHEQSYHKYFGTPFDGERVLTFTDPTEAERALAIVGCPQCIVDFESEIRIAHPTDANDVEDCVPITVYNDLVAPSLGSTISLCVDLSGSTEDAALTFDLKMIDDTSFDALQNGYLHNVDVLHDGESLLSEVIVTTFGEYQEFVVPLEQGFVGTLEISVIAEGTSVFLDNVAIDLGLLIGTEDPSDAANITYNNPAAEKLHISSNMALPAGSTASIFGSDGSLMLQTAIIGTAKTIDISELANGLYFLYITNGEALHFSGKVIHLE